jgi:hypothetical protein
MPRMAINSSGWRGLGDFALPSQSLFCPCSLTGLPYTVPCWSSPAPTGDAARACNALAASVVANAPPAPAGSVPLPGGLPYAGYENASVTMCKDPSDTVPAALLTAPLTSAPSCQAGSAAQPTAGCTLNLGSSDTSACISLGSSAGDTVSTYAALAFAAGVGVVLWLFTRK